MHKAKHHVKQSAIQEQRPSNQPTRQGSDQHARQPIRSADLQSLHLRNIWAGFVGRGDAILGATECQKTTNALHLHLWYFGERLHQFHTLEEIADLLRKGSVKVGDWKDYMSNFISRLR